MKLGDLLMVLLTVLFVGLKLTGHIAWSWLWVFSPIWLPFLVALSVIGLVAIVMGLVTMLKYAIIRR